MDMPSADAELYCAELKIKGEKKVVIWKGWIENKGKKHALAWYNLHCTATFAIADYCQLEYIHLSEYKLDSGGDDCQQK